VRRRDFVRTAGLAAAAGLVSPRPVLWKRSSRPRPSPAQLRWQREELALFVHFTVNTFTDREWGDGTESPAIFAPQRFDPRAWTGLARRAGFRSIVLTAKHHDGFCLWPTATTKHSIASSPWRDGRADVVGQLAEACRTDGLGLGLYLSPWDRHEPSYGDSPRYMDVYCAQLEELLTRYGSVGQVWFDGANGEGPNGKRQVYDWSRIHATVRRFQPEAVIFSDAGPDVRWIGNERGVAGETCWSTIDPAAVPYAGYDAPGVGEILQRGHPDGAVWRPGETDVSIRPGWFWHPRENDQVRSTDNLLDLYFTSVGRNSKLLLNVPPTRDGLFHPVDVARLEAFAARRNALFASDLARGASISGDDLSEVSRGGSIGSFWSADSDAHRATLLLTLRRPSAGTVLKLQEPIEHGQAIESFEIDGETTEGWRPLARGTTIGYCRLLQIPRTTCRQLRITLHSRLDTIRILPPALYDDPAT
jgi:alpha-L-fucosidase